MVKLKQRAYSVLIACLTAIMVVAFAIGALLVPPKTTTALAAEVTDTLSVAQTKQTGTAYSAWTYTATSSGAGYSGNSASNNGKVIQLKSSGSTSGIVTTTSGGKVKSIVVEWQSGTASGRTLDIYGKNTAYSAPTDLYSSTAATKGTKLGSIVKGTSTELTVSGDYEYIGMRSNSGAMYLTSIEITWEDGSGSGGETPECTHENLGAQSYEQLANNQHRTTATCLDCGETVSVTVDCVLEKEATSYKCVCERTVAINTITLSVNGTVQDTLETDKNQKVTLPTPSETFENYTFYGWVEEENATELPATVYKAGEVVFTETKTLYALYMNGEAATWNLVTDEGALRVGDQIIIAAAESDYALGTTQNTNNRKAVAITKDGNTATIDDTVQILTLEAGTVSGTFAFNTGSGYLFAASSSSNYLRTETTLTDNSSWEISITAAGVATITAQGANTRNQLKKNSSSELFSCYSSGQNDVAIYKKSGGAVNYTTSINTTCQHENTVTDEKAATCTEEGYKTITCANPECNTEISRETYPALGHEWNEGEVTTAATCQQKQVTTFTCQRENCGLTKTEEGEYAEHDYVENICTVCGEVDPLSIDYSGTYYLAAKRSTGNYFYATTDKESDYYKAVNSGVEELPLTGDAKVYNQVFQIIRSEEKYTLKAYFGSGDVIADSLTIEAVEGGFVHIINSDNKYFGLNSNEQYDRFKWYSDLMRIDLILVSVEAPTFDSASLTVGTSLDVNFYVNLPEGFDEAMMRFTMGDINAMVEAEKEENGERYVFVFAGVAPQFMGDTITARLMLGEEELLKKEYSVKTYVENQLPTANATLKQLLVNLLAYGEAAQEKVGYKTDALVTAGVDFGGLVADTATPAADLKYSLTTLEGKAKIFKGANLWFDNVNKICVKLNTTENVTLKVDGEAVALTENVYYTDDIFATGFAEEYTFEVFVDGELQQTLVYSVGSYVYSMVVEGKGSAEMQKLATALWNYGLAAKAYAENA